jgi:hypothetical protein
MAKRKCRYFLWRAQRRLRYGGFAPAVERSCSGLGIRELLPSPREIQAYLGHRNGQSGMAYTAFAYTTHPKA